MNHRFALVTGATGGLGAAFARALPETTDLLLTGRSEDRLAALREELAFGDRRIETLACDLAQPAERARLIARAEELEIDLLVNNAGLGSYGAVLDNDPAAEVETVEVNCAAPVALTTALLPGMIERARLDGGRAAVINVSSTFAVTPVPYLATYVATKAFLQSWTEALAEELRRKPVDVLALAPGAVRTPFASRAGFGPGRVPFAADPDDVAREGLQALGRCTVHVVGNARRALLTPYYFPRRVAASGLASLLGVVTRATRR